LPTPTGQPRPFPATGDEILEGAGHFLPWRDFLETTTPTNVPEERWRELLTTAPPDDEEE